VRQFSMKEFTVFIKCLMLTLLFTIVLSWVDSKAESYLPSKADLLAIGNIIAYDKSARYCYGFRVGDSNLVVTCRHCAVSDSMIFRPLMEKRYDTIVKIFESSPEYDLAVFKNISLISGPQLNVGNYNKTAIGDTVTVITYRSLDTMLIERRPINGIYGTEENGKIVEFIEIIGVGAEGTSGSPVLNDQGQVVAIVSKGTIDSTLTPPQYVAAAFPLKRIWHFVHSNGRKK